MLGSNGDWWLPNYQDTFDTLASAVLPGAVLTNVYQSGTNAITIGETTSPTLDYTGILYPPLMTKWKRVGNSTVGIANMLNLIWVDQLAQEVVGTKSLLNIDASHGYG